MGVSVALSDEPEIKLTAANLDRLGSGCRHSGTGGDLILAAAYFLSSRFFMCVRCYLLTQQGRGSAIR